MQGYYSIFSRDPNVEFSITSAFRAFVGTVPVETDGTGTFHAKAYLSSLYISRSPS